MVIPNTTRHQSRLFRCPLSPSVSYFLSQISLKVKKIQEIHTKLNPLVYKELRFLFSSLTQQIHFWKLSQKTNNNKKKKKNPKGKDPLPCGAVVEPW